MAPFQEQEVWKMRTLCLVFAILTATLLGASAAESPIRVNLHGTEIAPFSRAPEKGTRTASVCSTESYTCNASGSVGDACKCCDFDDEDCELGLIIRTSSLDQLKRLAGIPAR